MSRSLKLHPPANLPASGVTSVSFKAWQQTLIAYLEQDNNNFLFLPNGIYATWRPRGKNALRIPGLADDDPKRLEILNRLVHANQARDAHPDHPNNDAYDGAARDQDLAELLTSRNAQLSKFITHITMLCPYTLTNNLSQISTSFIWIDTYLQQYYNIRKQGAHFFSISSIRFNAGDSYQNFYMELHGALEDSLRPRGAVLLYKNDEVLEADEEMSPTLENFIILTWLERIDPRLPEKTAATFGHQITGNVSLRDLQPDICARIPSMLQELDEASANRASLGASAQDSSTLADTPIHAAMSFNRRGRFRGRSFAPPPRVGDKFCRICFIANKGSPRTYTSHSIANCQRLSQRDKQDLATRLNQLSLDEDEEEEDEHATPQHVPGWDDADYSQ